MKTPLDAFNSFQARRQHQVQEFSRKQDQLHRRLCNGRRSTSSDYERRSQVCCHDLQESYLLISCSAIFNDPDRLQRDFPVPICQCVQIKSLTTTTEGQPERYRLVLSDIDHYVQSMLATRKFPRRILGNRVNKYSEANHVVHEGKLKKGCFVRLKSYQANSVKGKKYVVWWQPR